MYAHFICTGMYWSFRISIAALWLNTSHIYSIYIITYTLTYRILPTYWFFFCFRINRDQVDCRVRLVNHCNITLDHNFLNVVHFIPVSACLSGFKTGSYKKQRLIIREKNGSKRELWKFLHHLFLTSSSHLLSFACTLPDGWWKKDNLALKQVKKK